MFEIDASYSIYYHKHYYVYCLWNYSCNQCPLYICTASICFRLLVHFSMSCMQVHFLWWHRFRSFQFTVESDRLFPILLCKTNRYFAEIFWWLPTLLSLIVYSEGRRGPTTAFASLIGSLNNFESVNSKFKLTSEIWFSNNPYEIVLGGMPLGPTNDKPSLVQVMVWCPQATNHYVRQFWHSYMSP